MSLPTIPDSAVEIAEEPVREEIRHAVFDLDGTISLMRDGWQDHMVPLMIETLESCPRHESREELQAMIIDFVDHLTGTQTIYQMIRLAEEVEKRGGGEDAGWGPPPLKGRGGADPAAQCGAVDADGRRWAA